MYDEFERARGKKKERLGLKEKREKCDGMLGHALHQCNSNKREKKTKESKCWTSQRIK